MCSLSPSAPFAVIAHSSPDAEHQELLPRRVLDAVNFENRHDSEFIDAFRSLELERLRLSAGDLQSHRDRWLHAHQHGDSYVNPVTAKLRGPLFFAMAKSVNYEELDPSFLSDLPGFPLVGQLPTSGPDTRVGGHPTENPLTVEELREQRFDRNFSKIVIVAKQ